MEVERPVPTLFRSITIPADSIPRMVAPPARHWRRVLVTTTGGSLRLTTGAVGYPGPAVPVTDFFLARTRDIFVLAPRQGLYAVINDVATVVSVVISSMNLDTDLEVN